MPETPPDDPPAVDRADPAADIDARLLAHLEFMNRFGEQDEHGTDLSLIHRNLDMTPLERIRQGDRHLAQHIRIRDCARRVC